MNRMITCRLSECKSIFLYKEVYPLYSCVRKGVDRVSKFIWEYLKQYTKQKWIKRKANLAIRMGVSKEVYGNQLSSLSPRVLNPATSKLSQPQHKLL